MNAAANAEQGKSGKDWSVRRVGTSSLAISKPKRNPRKLRRQRLKNRRGSR